MDISQILAELSHADGVSGCESDAAQTALRMLKAYSPHCYIKNGNVIGVFGDPDNCKLLLDAHIDQVGLIVTGITQNGFLRFSNIGGIDKRLLPAQQVKVHGKKTLSGVITSVPPHLSGGEKGKAQPIDQLLIDLGMEKQEVEKYVCCGDTVSFATRFRSLAGSRVTGRALDDRCGVAAILYALELLRDTDKNGIAAVFSVQEEIGERGAQVAAFDLEPKAALAVDVSFGYMRGESEHKCGRLGKGPMIGIAPSLSRVLSQRLIDTCKLKGIPYQVEVMNGLTSTNADRFSVNKGGCQACTVSIPLRFMHTPSELISLSDVENTGRLIAEFIKNGGAENV